MIPAFRIAGLVAALLMTGCAAPGYYYQALSGQMAVAAARRPIPEVMADGAAPRDLRARLDLIARAREFAETQLRLRVDGSFSSYADLGRPYAAWNVVATPEFSLAPKRWCFLIAGCISYRGYFSQPKAERFAERLRKRGYDVHVGGVAAYSTLGWFRDPVLNTTLRLSDAGAVAVVFHELAHARLYLGGDSMFSESFATAVEEEGVRRFFAGDELPLAAWRAARAQDLEFHAIVDETRRRLAVLYGSGADPSSMRAEKARALDAARAAYAQLKAKWGGLGGYDRFFDAGLNNARLAAVSLYREYVPAFATMIADAGGDMEVFYERAEKLARLSRDRRKTALEALARGAR
jgi:predicted aminopeptidase